MSNKTTKSTKAKAVTLIEEHIGGDEWCSIWEGPDVSKWVHANDKNMPSDEVIQYMFDFAMDKDNNVSIYNDKMKSIKIKNIEQIKDYVQKELKDGADNKPSILVTFGERFYDVSSMANYVRDNNLNIVNECAIWA